MLLLPFIFFLTATLSLLTMWWAEKFSDPVQILGGFLALQLSHNSGIAFGINLPTLWQERIIAFAIVLVIVFAYIDRFSTNRVFAYGMILGGAVANFVDRAIDGVVTDIFRVGVFPVFNLADASISLGVAILAVEIFFDE